MLKLNVTALDYALIILYFLVVLGIGVAARASIKTSVDFFLSGRSMPAWITGLAFIAANLGAIEILGMAANGAQYGVATVHFYWVGAVPAMVFLGLVMMPFYYGAKVRSVPEYLRLRFNSATHQFNAWTFAVGTILVAGVNLYALGLVMKDLLGWPLWVAVLVSAGFVLVYITLGGLSSAIYNEVLQFFVICAGLIPVAYLGVKAVGGFSGLGNKIQHSPLGNLGLHAWKGTGFGGHNPIGANWLGIVFGLGFVLSFGYWTTNFAEVQRALSARNLSAARRTSLIGAYPKIVIPAITVIPGLVALIVIPKLGGTTGALSYNNSIPLLMGKYLPNGVLGVAITGLLASFMAGMAANVSAFNTVVSYDIAQEKLIPGRSDEYYLRLGRVMTVVGIVIAIGTAFIASQFSNMMNYIQALFSVFNAPLFTTFIIGMFWKRSTTWGGFWGLLTGTVCALGTYVGYKFLHIWHFGSDLSASFIGAAIAFISDAVVTVLVSLRTQPKAEGEIRGLVYGLTRTDERPEELTPADRVWYRKPAVLGWTALAIVVVLDILFA